MSQEQKPEGDVVNELKLLGQQLGAAVKALWESEESKNLRKELAEGVSEVGRQLDTAIKSAQESEAAKEFSAQVKETVDKAREADIAEKVETGIVTGLRELNAQLDKMLRSWDVKKSDVPPPPDAEPKA